MRRRGTETSCLAWTRRFDGRCQPRRRARLVSALWRQLLERHLLERPKAAPRPARPVLRRGLLLDVEVWQGFAGWPGRRRARRRPMLALSADLGPSSSPIARSARSAEPLIGGGPATFGMTPAPPSASICQWRIRALRANRTTVPMRHRRRALASARQALPMEAPAELERLRQPALAQHRKQAHANVYTCACLARHQTSSLVTYIAAHDRAGRIAATPMTASVADSIELSRRRRATAATRWAD